jgi:hypothetical protein
MQRYAEANPNNLMQQQGLGETAYASLRAYLSKSEPRSVRVEVLDRNS